MGVTLLLEEVMRASIGGAAGLKAEENWKTGRGGNARKSTRSMLSFL